MLVVPSRAEPVRDILDDLPIGAAPFDRFKDLIQPLDAPFGAGKRPFLLEARAECERAVAEARTPSPFFAILDEMNLARVEHYFSDFLSCMESGEALQLHDDADLEDVHAGLDAGLADHQGLEPGGR